LPIATRNTLLSIYCYIQAVVLYFMYLYWNKTKNTLFHTW